MSGAEELRARLETLLREARAQGGIQELEPLLRAALAEHAVLCLRLLDRAEKLVRCGVAVRVRDQLQATVVGATRHTRGFAILHPWIAAVARLLSVRRHEVGLRQPGRLALRRAVENQLHTAQLEAAILTARNRLGEDGIGFAE